MLDIYIIAEGFQRNYLYRVQVTGYPMSKRKGRPKVKFKQNKDNESPLYFPWMVMCNGCSNPKSRDYPRLGAKGIYVCDEWRNDFKAFEAWSRRNGWEDGLKIDRYDLDGPFSPDNCAWGTIKREAPEPVRRKIIPSLSNGQTILSDFLDN